MDDRGTILYAMSAQPFLQKRAASVRKYNLPRSSVLTFFSFESGDSKLRIKEERSSSPLPGKNYIKKNWNGNDVNRVNILCQAQVAEKYGLWIWDSCVKKFTVGGFIVFCNKMLQGRESEGGVRR